jgi:two-component system response regulator FixJ
MSGLDLQRQVKSRAVAIPIIFITAHGDDETKSPALDGAAVFLIKPFSEEVVLDALSTALRGK